MARAAARWLNNCVVVGCTKYIREEMVCLYVFCVERSVRVLSMCPAYKGSYGREEFVIKLRALLGEVFKDF